ncbi:WUSCHEL-related homeobox 9-like isoform X2 [Dioscorea cayenensis subsp. rotundata]|nr:WUSCHEL-related homeobox 9-like isoform X2 [Dioscorea cayenensis subsp. rotundata]
MASSNRHWPSLFKSKPCNTHHQWQSDINHSSSLLSSSCQKPPFSSAGSVNDERTPEPKPRWNPKPEQIRILEAIFNSGMVNPPRDEIRRIRAQLQEYGQVGDANVFYWFQNRKSRSKHKQRQLAGRSPRSNTTTITTNAITNTSHAIKAFDPSSSSSSSSDRSSGGSDKTPPPPTSMVNSIIELSASPTPSVNQTLIHGTTTHTELSGEHFFFPAPPPQGYYFSDLMGVVSAPENGLWSDLISQENAKAGAGAGAMDVTEMTTNTNTANNTITSHVNELQGMGGVNKLMVFINEVVFEVVAGPLNVREAFGEEAVLLHASGQPVLTDEFGVTLQPLQHGASYYLV